MSPYFMTSKKTNLFNLKKKLKQLFKIKISKLIFFNNGSSITSNQSNEYYVVSKWFL